MMVVWTKILAVAMETNGVMGMMFRTQNLLSERVSEDEVLRLILEFLPFAIW
jgi:hypothetical protein